MNSKIPTILGILVLLVGVAVGVIFIQQETIYRLGASPDTMPRDVHITNITTNSFSVSWNTKKQTVGYVNWGGSERLGNTSRDALEPKFTHHIDIENLTPGATYYFEVVSDGDKYDNSGVLWSLSTSGSVLSPRSSITVSGVIRTSTGQPANDAVVYINGGGITPLSTKTGPDGRWFYPLSTALNFALTGYADIETSTLVEVYVQAGPRGVAAANARVGNMNPAPEMFLGNSYDFRSDSSTDTGFFDSSLSLKESGPEIRVSEPVTIESLQDGEIIYSSKPQFFGSGPAGNEIVVTIGNGSEKESVKVLGDSTWRWSPPRSLSEGNNYITVSWLDSGSILRSLTRSFVVYAQEEGPAFEASGSGGTSTPTPTPKATPTASPTTTASPIPTLSPSPTPTVTASATPSSSLPPAGVGIPTIVGVSSGLLFVLGSLLIAF